MKKWVTWLSLYLLTGCESILSFVVSISGCSVFLSDHALRKLSSTATISSYVCQKWSCPATRSPREDQALLLCRRLPLVPNKASSDAGPELVGRESRAAMENPKALMCPLENGDGGILTRHHQMPAEEQRSGGHALWCARRSDVPP